LCSSPHRILLHVGWILRRRRILRLEEEEGGGAVAPSEDVLTTGRRCVGLEGVGP
jgi:hypothetical protein